MRHVHKIALEESTHRKGGHSSEVWFGTFSDTAKSTTRTFHHAFVRCFFVYHGGHRFGCYRDDVLHGQRRFEYFGGRYAHVVALSWSPLWFYVASPASVEALLSAVPFQAALWLAYPRVRHEASCAPRTSSQLQALKFLYRVVKRLLFQSAVYTKAPAKRPGLLHKK